MPTMPKMSEAKPPTRPVLDAIEKYPGTVRRRFMELRALILQVAEQHDAIGTLVETLKWGEPAWLPRSKSGTTVRIAWKPKSPEIIGLYVSCNTTLMDDWRAQYDPLLRFDGRRAILLPIRDVLPTDVLRDCVMQALTYHLKNET